MIVNSTLKLENQKLMVDYGVVWSVGSTSTSTATVTALSYRGKTYLVTNAHAVVNSIILKVKFDQNSSSIKVKILWMDPVIDLALLAGDTEEENAFILASIKPLPLITEFQPKGTKVFAYGYAAGGRTLSSTEGTIARVEMSLTAFSHLNSVLVHTSTPIKPGNSGGPITVLGSERDTEVCIGIVSQGTAAEQASNKFIPGSMVALTIDTYETYKIFKNFEWIDYITRPTLGVSIQELKSKSLRQHLGLPAAVLGEELYGVRIHHIEAQSSAARQLQVGDILIEVDGHGIQSDGTVHVGDFSDPISWSYIIQQKNYLDRIKVVILRPNVETRVLERKEIELRLTLQLGQKLHGFRQEKPVSYYIHPSGEDSGFVFVGLSQSYLEYYTPSSKPAAVRRFQGLAGLEYSAGCKEAIFLDQAYASDVTEGYDGFSVVKSSTIDRVSHVNGTPVSSLYELKYILSHSAGEAEILFTDGKVIYMPPAKEGTEAILKDRYKIAFMCSPGLRDVDKTPVLAEIKSLAPDSDIDVPTDERFIQRSLRFVFRPVEKRSLFFREVIVAEMLSAAESSCPSSGVTKMSSVSKSNLFFAAVGTVESGLPPKSEEVAAHRSSLALGII